MFNFDMVQISPGTVLSLNRDPEITCTVVDNRNVEFEGNIVTLTAAAKEALAQQGINWKAVSGPNTWEYEGETLYERRKRMELDG